ncbi:MAG: C-type lectin domain-containing protein, partial [Mariniphaga sp.]
MNTPQHIIKILLLFFFWNSYVSAQDPDESVYISNPDTDTLFYCGSPVAVAPGIIIENFDVVDPTDGIKISIDNYVPGEDALFYTGTAFDWEWDANLGNLEITGQGSAAELQEAIRNVFYENTSGNPVTEFRSISISLLDADYLPETGHFYRFIPQVDIAWDEARDAAAELTYYGLQGYLATITSEAENDFIWTKIDGLGWIGATDKDNEGTWEWATGPEAGTVFWQGNASGAPVGDNYSNWSEGEPNDNYGEDYAHINQDSNKEDKTWNDLRIGGDGIPGSAYRSQGYVVEFGGMPDDPELKLSASAVIGVNQVPEFLIQDFDTLVCGKQVQQLNIQVDQGIFTVLRPLDDNSIVRDSTSLSPTVEVTENGRYRFELEVYSVEQCSGADTITISFQNQPVAGLNLAEAACVDYNLPLSFRGEVEDDAFFEWYSNDTVYTSGVNLDSLIIPVGEGVSNRTVGLKVIENGCADSVQIPVTVKPRVQIKADPPEGCTPLDVQFNYSATEAIEETSWDIG